MPNLDDDQFEIYLKNFRPLPPVLLPLSAPAKVVSQGKRRRRVLLAWALPAAAAIILGVFLLRLRVGRPGVTKTELAQTVAHSQPFTLDAANELLANSHSFQVALDSLESESGAVAIPKGKQSALAVLGEENLKP